MQTQWFQNWFGSPYYPILYKKRSHQEAQLFIDKLLQYLKPVEKSRILDLACGRGRHSIYLNSKGYDVTGIDISEESISEALTHANNTLSFYVQDMRNAFTSNYFDYVLNLFTSIGYFASDHENERVIRTAAVALKPNGTLVIDFIIKRAVENAVIVKKINVSEKGIQYQFEERVRALTLADFERYFAKHGLQTQALFGDYELNSFNNIDSDRLIIIAKRTN